MQDPGGMEDDPEDLSGMLTLEFLRLFPEHWRKSLDRKQTDGIWMRGLGKETKYWGFLWKNPNFAKF